MMIQRPAAERGTANFDWLHSRHSFSFGHYHDPRHMGFGPLRVINEDVVAPAKGFATHGHQDMEILTYVIEGALEHKDSMGNGSMIRPGDVQRMTAGTGVRHSEYNASATDPVHFLQIWILPESAGLAPGYEQLSFPPADRRDQWRLVGSREGREGSITIHQDVDLYAGVFSAGAQAEFQPGEGRMLWLQVVRGKLRVNGMTLFAGDGLAMSEEPNVKSLADAESEVLLFDMTGSPN